MRRRRRVICSTAGGGIRSLLKTGNQLRAIERQAAEELAQWKVVIESRKVLDATPAAVMLGMIMSKEQLLELR